MNKVILVGNLTKDPEITTTSNGVSVCRFTVAISRRFASSDGGRETDFINIVAWRALADNCHKFLKKGSKVGVVGSLQVRNYDAQDGSKRYITEVVAEEVEFLNTSREADKVDEVSKLEPIDDDNLPF